MDSWKIIHIYCVVSHICINIQSHVWKVANVTIHTWCYVDSQTCINVCRLVWIIIHILIYVGLYEYSYVYQYIYVPVYICIKSQQQMLIGLYGRHTFKNTYNVYLLNGNSMNNTYCPQRPSSYKNVTGLCKL